MTGGRHIARAAATCAALLASTALAAQANPAPPTPPPGQAPAPAPGGPATPSARVLINQEAADKSVFQFDFGVPSSPSLNLLGQPEDKVTVVNGLKPFILQLPRILGADAEGGQSVGLDFSPAWLIGDSSQHTIENYTQRGSLYRILTRTHIGVALYEGVADADPSKARPSRIAVGLSTSLLDSSDPFMARVLNENTSAWQRCMDLAEPRLQNILDRSTASDGGAKARLREDINVLRREREAIDRLDAAGQAAARVRREEIQAAIAALQTQLDELESATRSALQASFTRSEAARIIPACAQEANLAARYGASLAVGVGTLWNGDPGRVRNLSSAGWVAWAAFRHPLAVRFRRETDGTLKASNYWMIGFSGRASADEIVATNDAATPLVRANVFDGWGGIEYLSSASRFAFQLGYQIRDTEGRLASFDRERLRYFASYSQRLGNENSGIWVRVGYGHARSSDDDDEAFTVSLIFAPPSPANLFGTN